MQIGHRCHISAQCKSSRCSSRARFGHDETRARRLFRSGNIVAPNTMCERVGTGTYRIYGSLSKADICQAQAPIYKADHGGNTREATNQRVQQAAHLLPKQCTRVPGGKAWPLSALPPPCLRLSAEPFNTLLSLSALDSTYQLPSAQLVCAFCECPLECWWRLSLELPGSQSRQWYGV